MHDSVIRAAARRQLGSWMQGPKDAVHHDTFELCILLAGRIHFKIGDVTGAQWPGYLGVIPPGTLHSSWTEEESAEEIVIHLAATAVRGELGPDGLGTGLIRLAESDHHFLTEVAGSIDHPIELESRVWTLLRFISGRSTGTFHDERVLRVMHAVQEELARSWSITDLARIATMSPAHFSRRFREVTGKSPMRFLRDLRLERARWLIETTQTSLTDIGHSVGFSSSSRLSEAFQQRHGMPPSAWRSAHGR